MEFTKLGSLMALAFSPLCVDAADVDIQRIEIEPQSSEYILGCNGIGSHGLILTSKIFDNQKETKTGHERLTFTKYDTLLNKVTSTEAEFMREIFVKTDPPRRFYRDYSNAQSLGKVYMKRNTGAYEILHVDGETMETKTLTGEVGKRSKLTYSKALGNYVYMAGRQGGVPYVYSVNIKTGEGKMNLLPVAEKRKSYMLSFETDDMNNEVHLIIQEKQDDKYSLNLYVFADGALSSHVALDPDLKEKDPESAFASKMEDGSYIICGTYSEGRSKHTTNSVGVYFKKVENGKTACSSFVNYLDVNNFNSYLSEHKQEKIEKKKTRKEKEGKEYAIHRNMLPYKVIEKDGKYLLAGEAYYPTYTSRPQTVGVSDGNGGTTYQTTYIMEFDSYKFTHYFVLEFDQQGKMVWSNASSLDVNNSVTLDRHLSINNTNQSVEILYPSLGHMNRDSYSKENMEIKKEEIPFVADDETIKKYKDLRTESWGDGAFLSSGLFNVKNEDDKRRVYSINRVKLGI